MTTYRNAFHRDGLIGETYGPEVYSTDVKPVEHRGFLIYQRISDRRGGFGGVADTVIDGLCIMNSVTVEGAKGRINRMLDGDEYEQRAVALMALNGIAIPGELFPRVMLEPEK